MSQSVTITISATVTGDGEQLSVTKVLTNGTATPIPIQNLVCTATVAMVVTVPSGVANGVLIVPPASSASTKVYKGIAGDNGIVAVGNQVALFGQTSGTFVIQSTANETLQLIWC